MTQYQKGVVPDGDKALTMALAWQKDGSKWLYQIATADNLCKTNPGGRFQPRTAMTLYEQLVHDPTAGDWSMRPLESLAVMSTPQPTVYEHWFEFAAQLSDAHAAGVALDVAELARRQRFLSTLPLGGRLMALRWLLESPEESLGNTAKIHRQELLSRFPKYAESMQKVRQLQTDLAQATTAAKPESQRELAAKFGELASLSATQEAVLHEMAVSREPAEIMFPPIRKAKDVQENLAPGHILLTFYTTNHGTYAWMYSKEKSQQWKINNPALLDRRIVALLRAVGNADASRELTESQLADVSWKQAAHDVQDALLQGSKISFSNDSAEVTIVPDGMLWYLPFELLPLGSESKEFRPLLMRSQVRYAPTLGLTVADRQGRKSAQEYGIVTGKLYPTDTAEVSEAAVAEIRRVAPQSIVLHNPLPAISPLLGTVVDGLIVLDEISETQAPYDWSPVPLDKPRTAGAMNVWMALPWKSVDQFILPGFHTAAENSLKSPGSNPGNEMFLSTMALMSTGARTVLVSRWRTGGESAIDLIREFVQELPFETAAAAWQRAVQVTSQTPIDMGREPRSRQQAQRSCYRGRAAEGRSSVFLVGIHAGRYGREREAGGESDGEADLEVRGERRRQTGGGEESRGTEAAGSQTASASAAGSETRDADAGRAKTGGVAAAPRRIARPQTPNSENGAVLISGQRNGAAFERFVEPFARGGGPGAFRRQAEKFLPVRRRFVAAIEIVQGAGQMEMGVGVIGVQGQGAFECGDRQFSIAQLCQHAAEIGAGFDVVFVEFDGRVVALSGGGNIAEAIQQFGHGEADRGRRTGGGGVCAIRFDGGGQIAFIFQIGGQAEHFFRGQRRCGRAERIGQRNGFAVRGLRNRRLPIVLRRRRNRKTIGHRGRRGHRLGAKADGCRAQ